MTVVVALAPLVLAGLMLLTVARTAKRPPPLCRYECSGGTIVVRVDVPRWMAFRRTLTAPVTDVVAARVVPAGESTRLLVRVCGLRWPGFQAGWFWRRGGRCYVVRRRRYDAVEIVLARGRVRTWIVEVDEPATVVADLNRLGVPSATPTAVPTTRR